MELLKLLISWKVNKPIHKSLVFNDIISICVIKLDDQIQYILIRERVTEKFNPKKSNRDVFIAWIGNLKYNFVKST